MIAAIWKWLRGLIVEQVDIQDVFTILEGTGVPWEPKTTGAYIGAYKILLRITCTLTDTRVRFRSGPPGLPLHPWEVAIDLQIPSSENSVRWEPVYRASIDGLHGSRVTLYKEVLGFNWARLVGLKAREIRRVNAIAVERLHAENFTTINPEDWDV